MSGCIEGVYLHRDLIAGLVYHSCFSTHLHLSNGQGCIEIDLGVFADKVEDGSGIRIV